MLTNPQGLALLCFLGGSPLRDCDYAPAMQVAKMGLVAWTIYPFAIVPHVTPEGLSALIAFLDDDALCVDLGLIEACPRTMRSGEWIAVEWQVAS